MELELSKEFIEEHKLTDEQVTAVTTIGNNAIADTKKTYDGKAHNDAQAILDGASTKITELTKVTRNQSEKAADFMLRAWGEFSSTSQSGLDKAKTDYEEKVANFKGDEATATALVDAKKALDDAQKKYADYDDLKGTADKYVPLQESHDKLKLDYSFGQLKPNFPDTVNAYEAEAKWNEFKQSILKDNDIEIVDGEAMAISKENHYKSAKLKDLISNDDIMSELMKGREQGGSGTKPIKKKTIEGVPFEVPVDVSAKDMSKLIQDHLNTKGINKASNSYSQEFSKLYTKIKAQQTA